MPDSELANPLDHSTRTRDTRIWMSVGAAIYECQSDAFLLIQRADNGLWELPGGLVETGERLADAEQLGTHPRLQVCSPLP